MLADDMVDGLVFNKSNIGSRFSNRMITRLLTFFWLTVTP